MPSNSKIKALRYAKSFEPIDGETNVLQNRIDRIEDKPGGPRSRDVLGSLHRGRRLLAAALVALRLCPK